MNVWWVNHKQTYLHEKSGGYIWSPKRKSNGSGSHFYDNMARVAPGDIVISFANALISDIGVATASAAATSIPQSHIQAGENWTRNEGWLVPIQWTALVSPVVPQQIIADLGPLLPGKYSPIRPEDGHGNQGAYLSSVSEAVLHMVLKHATEEDRERVSGLNTLPKLADPQEAAEEVIEAVIAADPQLEVTEKMSLVAARRGQGVFRKRLQEIEQRCRLTGVEKDDYLVASHILPWRLCTSSAERLDGHNGLLLTPNADRLFDRGMLSFSDDGSVLVSETLAEDDLVRLGLPNLKSRNVGGFSERQRRYLKRHRQLSQLE